MRILIAGLGAIGQRHARNLRTLYGDSLELLAFRTRRLPHVITPALARDDSRDVEEALGARVFLDLEDALAARPDAVFVCTPTSQHLDVAIRSARAGCHLFIEKPLSDSLDGVETLRTAVRESHLVVLVGCQWRYHPSIAWLRAAVQRGSLGRITGAELHYAEYLPDWHPYEDYRESYAARSALGGGVVLTQIHDYDLAWWLFGPPAAVSATGGHLSDLEIDVEDTVDARLEGMIPVRVRQSCASRPPCRTLRVVSERGTVTIDLVAARVRADGQITPPAPMEYDRNEMFMAEAKHFDACLSGADTPAVPLDDGIAVLKLALAVKEAIRTGRTVTVEPAP